MAKASKKSLILYDGECGLCDRVVQFVLKRDVHDRFEFAALQSDLARTLLQEHGHDPDEMNTFYLVSHHGQPEEALANRGLAGVQLLTRLGGIWKLAGILRLAPRFILDFFYSLIANHRYRLFGRRDSCLLPSPENRKKFIA